MKKKIRALIPEFIIILYHKVQAHLAAFYFGYPGRKMVCIGITGTKGKTSTANFIWSVLKENPLITPGLIGTANIRIGQKEILNDYHMTMPNTWILQRFLKKMKDAGCTHVVVEVTSEGMKLGRHIGIPFDVAIFTNLSPEHLPSHNNSFDEYKKTKGILFKQISSHHKKIKGERVPKMIIANADDEHSKYFLDFKADKKITYGMEKGDIVVKNCSQTKHGVIGTIDGVTYTLSILGVFNMYNALPAYVIAKEYGFDTKMIGRGLQSLQGIPGRMEKIDEGQPFSVFVDYAHEKLSMNALLDSARALKSDGDARVIVLFGAQGGGRDKEKRKWMGYASGEKADIVILTKDDSYEEFPRKIMEDIAVYVREKEKIDEKNLFLIVDRREAIKKAFTLAKEHDIVLLAGKGAEQFIIENNAHISWDDRRVARELLLEMGYSKNNDK